MKFRSLAQLCTAILVIGAGIGTATGAHAVGGATSSWQTTAVPGGGTSTSFTVNFFSTTAGQGYVLFGTGPGCSGLVMTATQDQGAGTARHSVVVTGNDLGGSVGNNGIIPGVTYYYEVVSVSSAGVETDNNNGSCYSVTVPSVRYHVTLTNTTVGQGFSFPVAATHAASVHMFQVGQKATTAAAAIAQNGNPVPMYNLLKSTPGVTDVYVHPFPVASAGNPTAFWKSGLPTFRGGNLVASTSDTNLSNAISFDISANPGDMFSVLGMLMCTTDGLSGLDGVALPADAAHPVSYALASYDAGVEANTYYTPDIVDPCALMAPYKNGAPALSTTDGNRNSPPTPSQGYSGNFNTEPDLNVPLATSDPIAPLSGVIPDNSGKPNAGSFVPAAWGWTGPVGNVTITKLNG